MFRFYCSGVTDPTPGDSLALELFHGFTRFEGFGGWKDPEGNTYREPVTVWEIIPSADDEAKGRDRVKAAAFRAFRKGGYNQQEVLVVYLGVE